MRVQMHNITPQTGTCSYLNSDMNQRLNISKIQQNEIFERRKEELLIEVLGEYVSAYLH